MKKATKRLTADERKRQILRADIKTFAKSNYRVTRVIDIASEAGISDALIYKYFPSRKGLLVAIIDYISNRMKISRPRQNSWSGKTGQVHKW